MPPKRKVYDSDEEEYEQEEEQQEKPSRKVSTSAKSKRSSSSSAAASIKETSYLATDSSLGSSGYLDLSETLVLKKDHERRPIWISTNNIIILEAFSKYYNQAYDFLIDIAEPVSRPTYFQTYQLTEDSLYSAVAVSRSTESIIKYLNILCKTNIPPEVESFIRSCTSTFGKAKLVLKNNTFYVESQFPDILRELLKNPNIRDARITDAAATSSSSSSSSSSTTTIVNKNNTAINTSIREDGFLESSAPKEDRRERELLLLDDEYYNDGDEDGDENGNSSNDGGGEGGNMSNASKSNTIINSLKTVSFMVSQNLVHEVKRCAKDESRYPLLEEYDFRGDLRNPNLIMDLRPSTVIRPYQEKSLSKMFGNGRARSGIIVLPCGAGKTLTGVTAASTVKKSVIVLCINNASVKQWKEQFLMWTTVPEKSLKIFTSSTKGMLPDIKEACVLMTTYSMICHSGKRSEPAQIMMNSVTAREWGLMLLDEVHVAPADMFQKVLQIVNAHCKLGLTATLVREDNKIKDLSFLVGPKLYEANWIDLTNQQYLARAQCVEVWCPMTKEFYAEYIRCGSNRHTRTQQLLYLLNPRKFRVCEYLVKYHLNRGDKIIIFSDDLPALRLYCENLSPIRIIPYISGEIKEEERRKLLTAFKTHPEMNCIGLSAVGDTALDIPEANVIIQVSSHFGARRQEAQRLGRILRPKTSMTTGNSSTPGGFNAFFYSLVSSDTRESYFSTKRQQYLIDQGYTFKVVQDLADKADKESIILTMLEQEMLLLNTALTYRCEALDNLENTEVNRINRGENEEDEMEDSQMSRLASSSLRGGGGGDSSSGGGSFTAMGVKRKQTSLGAISGGGDGTIYSEFQTRR